MNLVQDLPIKPRALPIVQKELRDTFLDVATPPKYLHQASVKKIWTLTAVEK